MDVIQDISPKDDMYQGNKEHYFHVGESALECILSAISAAGKDPEDIKSILDLPCGYGRVLRVLRAAFPDVSITACDLEKSGVDFCANTFGARPVYSNKVISNIPVNGNFDLIWVGSLFTHLNLSEWHKFLEFFSRKLNPGGLVVISLHGPFVVQNIMDKGNTYGLMQDALDSLLKQYHQSQFAYVNYPNSNDYGISISSPGITHNILKKFPELDIISYTEKAWDQHQDVLCCQKKMSGSLKNKSAQNTFTGTKDSKQIVEMQHEVNGKSNVIFCLPEGLTLGGVTTWSVELSRELKAAGFSTALGVHPSRYNNPPVDFEITEKDHLIDCTHLLHPDDPKLDPEDYVPYYSKALPGVLIPNWSLGTYAMASRFASQRPEMLRVIGMAHSDEIGYYQSLVYYEAMIHKFLVANSEIQHKLSRLIPHRFDDILIMPCPVSVSMELNRTYSPTGKPLQLVYGGRIAQYQKRVFDFIDLIKALMREGVNFNFRIIGGGADRDDFHKKVNQLPEKTRSLISLEDSIPPSQMAEVWHSADINIMVSDFEGVSNSMLMGMAEGCVPVMTEVSGTSEVITSGEDGYLVPVGNMEQMAKVIKILDQDRRRLADLGKKAHNKIKTTYSMKDYVPRFTNVVNEIWEKPARPWPPPKSPMAFEAIHQEVIRLNERTAQKSDQKKKVLFMSHDANWGGAPKVLYSLVKGLDKNKWSSIVALPEHGELEKEFEKIGIQTMITPMRNITTDAKGYWQQYVHFSSDLRQRIDKVVDIIDREQVNLVVTNTICIFEGALAAKLTGVPHIWYVHELCSKDDQLTPILDYPTFYATMDSLSDKMVVVSKAVQDEMSRFFPSKKLELIYTGLEKSTQAVAVDKKKILGIDPEIPVVAYIGVISERKGILWLVDTAVIVAKKFPQVKFVIAGRTEGETYAKLQLSLKQKQLEDKFKFLGFRNDVLEVIACSDVIAVPSLTDPFPLVALEAMESSRPVVATRSGGLEEMVLDEETGILVPVKSPLEMARAIIRLLENPDLMNLMGQEGRKRFTDSFNYEGYIRHFNNLFEEVTSQAKPKGSNNQSMVENFITLATEAAQAKARLAELNQKEDPIGVVKELLNYPGYIPYDILPHEITQRRPKVSVCVPVFNGSEYIRDCIDSILSQTFTDFELVIVNDASTDDSKKIIQSYDDPRIKYFENDRNLGLIGNWNQCLQLSSGDYICIFHQDDRMSPNNLEKKVILLGLEKQVGLVYSDTLVIDQKGMTKSKHWFNPIDPNVDFIRPGQSFFDLMFVNLNLICCPSVMARRECYEKIGGFDARLPFSGDMEMWMRIALFYDVAYLSQPLIQYRFHDNNLTHRFLALDLIHIYLCKRMLLEKYPQRFDRSYFKTLIEDSSLRIFDRAVHHYRQHQYKTAKQYLVFLEMIRNGTDKPELIDIYIEQLLSYVNQANAMNWLGLSKKGIVPASVVDNRDGPFKPNRSEATSAFVTAIKPYIPPRLKKPLKDLRNKLSDYRKS